MLLRKPWKALRAWPGNIYYKDYFAARFTRTTKIKPGIKRHSLDDIVEGIKITIPSRKRWWLIIIIFAWLGAWSIGGIATGFIVILSLSGGDLSGDILFMLFWLIGWAAGETFAIFVLFWQIAGKENLLVGRDSVVHSRKIFGVGRTKEYEYQYVKDWRYSNNPGTGSWERGMTFYGLGNGLLAFDYGAKTVRIVSDVDEAEAKQILKTILDKYPQYATEAAVN
ncbi:MAG: hypothetical protein N2C13_04985 [Chloroflexota bacterium]